MIINCNINPDYIKYIDELILLTTTRDKLTFNAATADLNIDITEHVDSITCSISYLNNTYTTSESKDNLKLLLKRAVYKTLSKALKVEISPWGILTGVRPTKVIQGFTDDGLNEKEIVSELTQNYLVSPAKVDIMYKIREEQEKINQKIHDKLHLYIGIPFCPTRCSYCSFTSYTTQKSKSMIEPYVNGLLEEIKFWASYIQEKNIAVATVYIGGGTPSSLNTQQLGQLLKTIAENINLNDVLEYTFEGGRPDTLSGEKLELIKRYGVTRLSINPQTMKNHTLQAMGRTHTKEEFIETFSAAKAMGFDWINTDLIIGLNQETFADYKNTLEEIVALNPENITIHALALKRAALQKAKSNLDFTEVKKIMDFTYEIMEKNHYSPYYLYRQKSMAGNQENVGFAKNGLISPYNVVSIEETGSVIAMGSGGVSKIIKGKEIIRFSNPKDPNQYLEKISDKAQLRVVVEQIER